MTYEEWERTVPAAIKREPVWGFYGYRKALFLHDLAWDDCGELLRDDRGRAVAYQLIRSAGSIGGNIEEGHGRGFVRKEYQQFLRYALGSARETKGSYFRGRRMLSPAVVEARFSLLDEIIALIVTEMGKSGRPPK
ncbi:MAG: four helix bundle protein [Planctomycetes bacterium]|nr:four helix bundle protein [Planctomycetota bacterium]MBM4083274.1 four helix bundle protein [Planctomycetota bacterium]